MFLSHFPKIHKITENLTSEQVEHAHLFCCVWGNCSNEGLNRILKLQKKTARLILDQNPIAPSEPLFKQLGWMSIEQRIKYHKYLLVSKCLKNEAPTVQKATCRD